ncbi:signal peptidase I Serine peptidase. MEROPS family S26A [Pseudorhodobacter antarcticus]|jgi:signal peptidase I|uniref:Signal peptidase I n=1 Tax=Pseudorhodobacter antarcticus TaxID=1077947 RepID=A0A1H8IZN2_9RHOB|nr:signal peptidase I [Pseudorhodobacter antarcticus]SEN73595.1 signal peptidase I Serine peptidase. MEROPS family S26A [Pseudorhodobacter antarcticus]
MASKDNTDGGIVETIKTIVYALLIAGIFRTLFFQPFWIPSGSMKDTLLIGDFLFVNKMAYGYSKNSCPFSMCPVTGRLLFSEPERGDVVVFRHPVNGSDFIKRLIGLPGDTVQMRAGQIILNGTPVPQTPDGQFIETYAEQGPMRNMPRCENAGGTVGLGGECTKSRSIETLPGGRTHAVLNIDVNGFADNTDVFTVPVGQYFFMGDNRDNSQDSRFGQASGGVGFVPAENLIGRADRIMFSSAGSSLFYFWTWRSDRFFKAVE